MKMQQLVCTKCGGTKPLNQFRTDNSTKSGYKQPCRKCNSAQAAIWIENSESFKTYQKNWAAKEYQNLRNEVLNAYGNACACCGETEPCFLAVDHIFNDGAKHRQNIGRNLYRWLRNNNFPKDRFQLLCHNCNAAKSLYGICPHQK